VVVTGFSGACGIKSHSKIAMAGRSSIHQFFILFLLEEDVFSNTGASIMTTYNKANFLP